MADREVLTSTDVAELLAPFFSSSLFLGVLENKFRMIWVSKKSQFGLDLDSEPTKKIRFYDFSVLQTLRRQSAVFLVTAKPGWWKLFETQNSLV